MAKRLDGLPLGKEVGLRPDHIVLDGDPAPPHEKDTVAPTFRPMSIVAKQLTGSSVGSSNLVEGLIM